MGVWIFHYVFNDWLNKRFPFERNVSKRITIQLLGGWSMVNIALLISSFLVIHPIIPTLTQSINRLTMIALGAILFLVNVVISLGFIANHLFYRWQENRLRTQNSKKKRCRYNSTT